MKIDSHTIIFSSGRSVYANLGIIGLSPTLELSYGYDGSIDWPPYETHSDSLTVEDMKELADYMVGQWTRFKEGLK
jgi:hypothetical protein